MNLEIAQKSGVYVLTVQETEFEFRTHDPVGWDQTLNCQYIWPNTSWSGPLNA